MGFAISSIYTMLFTSQLCNIEAEATSLMRASTADIDKETRMLEQLRKSSKSAVMPNKEDYYYEQATGVEDKNGETYNIDPKYQNYKPVTTESGTYVNLTATRTASGSTLKLLKTAVVSEDKVGEYPVYDMESALSDGTISQEDFDKLVESGVHYFSAEKGFDDKGNVICTKDYIKNNYKIVKISDTQWGLVSKSAKVGEKTDIYQVTANGEYQELVKQIQAYNLKMDARGNIIGFKNAEGNDVKLTTKRVFDQEGYDAAMKKWNEEQDTDETEAYKDRISKTDETLETRLNELATMKTMIDGFLESTKKLAKESAERSGKTFGG